MAIEIPNILNKKPKTQVSLTALGKTKIDGNQIDPTTPKGKVLWYLKEHGQSNMNEIAEETGISFWRVKDICAEYANPQYRWIEWV